MRSGESQLDCSEGCPLLKASADKERLLGTEVWRPAADGRRQPLLATVSAVTDADGNVSDVIHSLRDITRLKEADEAKTLFLATASHELKTPLTVIQGFAQLLSSTAPLSQEDRETALATIARRASQLNDIVDRVLLSSRIEAGRVEVVRTPLDIMPILQERTESLRSATGREVVFDAPESLPTALGDANAIATVLDHLLENAVKYSPDGGRVLVRTSVDEKTVVMTVSDSGIGMAPDQLARCFDKFWQAESSDVRRFGGTGIGLYIVRSLVEGMGGDVRAESSLGNGTTFVVTFVRAGAVLPRRDEQIVTPGVGEQSMVREFMRQMGIPTGRVR